MSNPLHLSCNDCLVEMKTLKENSVDALITDPPYGISYQAKEWDKALPDAAVWAQCLRVMKPGAYGAVFSSVRLMHRMMVSLEDAGFIIKDVLFWVYLNGMPKNRDIGVAIDQELGVKSQVVGCYKYVQGYKKDFSDSYGAEGKARLAPNSDLGKQYAGAGQHLKPCYDPIILVQKPLRKGLTVAQNVLQYGTGALNIEQARLPYEAGESKVGHNPHPYGRIPGNIVRTEHHFDGYDKFFAVAKVKDRKKTENFHPTVKPVELMQHLVKLLSFESQLVLDPFMGSGSTGVAALACQRSFSGIEISREYFGIASERLGSVVPISVRRELRKSSETKDLFDLIIA